VIIIGLDPHPGSHAVAALDENRTVLGHPSYYSGQRLAVANDAQGLRSGSSVMVRIDERVRKL